MKHNVFARPHGMQTLRREENTRFQNAGQVAPRGVPLGGPKSDSFSDKHEYTHSNFVSPRGYVLKGENAFPDIDLL